VSKITGERRNVNKKLNKETTLNVSVICLSFFNEFFINSSRFTSHTPFLSNVLRKLFVISQKKRRKSRSTIRFQNDKVKKRVLLKIEPSDRRAKAVRACCLFGFFVENLSRASRPLLSSTMSRLVLLRSALILRRCSDRLVNGSYGRLSQSAVVRAPRSMEVELLKRAVG
jgi:hypothetical protein